MRNVVLGGLLISLALVPKFALAEEKADFPFTGYFSQQLPDTPPGFKQAMCALSFFKQTADGSVVAYELDWQHYKAHNEVRYLEDHRTQCDYNALDQTNECLRVSEYGQAVNKSKFYEHVENIQSDEPILRGFPNRKALDYFLKSADPANTAAIAPSFNQNHLHRCVGFNDEVLAKHISKDATAPTPKGLLLFRAGFQKEQAADAMRIMELISAEALNATLPGQ